MKKLDGMIRSLLVCLLVGAGWFQLFAQTNQTLVTVSPLVGPEIDPDEYYRFGMSRIAPADKSTLKNARVIFDPDANLYWLVLRYISGDSITQMMSPEEFASLSATVSARGARVLEVWEEGKNQLPQRMDITLESGMRVIGSWDASLEERLVVTTDVGTLVIPLENILFMSRLAESDLAGTGFRSPNSSRYLFAPSAIPLDKGERYYQNVWVVLNTVTFGVSDHVTVTAGVEAISTLVTLFTDSKIGPGMMGNVKYSTQVSDNVYLGGGILAAATLGESFAEANVALGYGIATIGNPDDHLTLGVGSGIFGGEWTQGPVLVLGGTKRLSRTLSLVSENWVAIRKDTREGINFPDPVTGEPMPAFTYTENQILMAFSGGVRILTEKNTFDIALVTAGQVDRYQNYPYSDGSWSRDWLPIPLPYLDFVYQF